MQNSRRKFIRNTGGAIASLMLPKTNKPSIQATINIFSEDIIAPISPNIFGQFIEYVDNSIDGGIFDEHNKLSDEHGFRKDVLSLMNELQPTTLRYPGGTVTKIYHWKDGIGPKKQRPVHKNLIWGGLIDNQFGTDEYITYCKTINTQPFITVNMSTGTAEEAMEWVAYCNDADSTYWANQRALNASKEPYNVKIWGLGNEEAAKEDAGRLQKVQDYIENAWYYAKLMKLQDPTIQLVLVGDDELWNEQILKELNPIADYISLHLYAATDKSNPISLFASIQEMENKITKTIQQIKTLIPEKVDKFSKWYRFPPRENTVKIALDEWGIWENNGAGKYGLEVEYTWNHALGTASMLNAFIRHAEYVTLANWAQSVNVLSAITTNNQHAIKQTVFYPLSNYRKYCGSYSIKTECISPLESYNKQNISALDVVAILNTSTKQITLIVVNRSEKKIDCPINLKGKKSILPIEVESFTASNRQDKNSLSNYTKDVVQKTNKKYGRITNTISIQPLSINFIQMLL